WRRAVRLPAFSRRGPLRRPSIKGGRSDEGLSGERGITRVVRASRRQVHTSAGFGGTRCCFVALRRRGHFIRAAGGGEDAPARREPGERSPSQFEYRTCCAISSRRNLGTAIAGSVNALERA